MTILDQLIVATIAAISVGGVIRIAYCIIQIAYTENGSSYKTRAINCGIFMILSYLLTPIVKLILLYVNRTGGF